MPRSAAHAPANRTTGLPGRAGVVLASRDGRPVCPSGSDAARGNAREPGRTHDSEGAGRGHVVIVGYGPVGRALADRLRERGIPFTVVETNAETVRVQEALGVSVLHGDGTDPDVLKAADIEGAALIAITIPDCEQALQVCRAARRLSPGAFIAVRVAHLSHGLNAIRAGADSITVEEVVAAEAMAREVTRHLGREGGRTSNGGA